MNMALMLSLAGYFEPRIKQVLKLSRFEQSMYMMTSPDYNDFNRGFLRG